jgi:hypothetical protein
MSGDVEGAGNGGEGRDQCSFSGSKSMNCELGSVGRSVNYILYGHVPAISLRGSTGSIAYGLGHSP